ncbi:MAG TPA: hypothetical protein VFB62_23060 [Polyangiaceae bacterium]|nr:hypothetical protein [Polyangiaceae bacterium]
MPQLERTGALGVALVMISCGAPAGESSATTGSAGTASASAGSGGGGATTTPPPPEGPCAEAKAYCAAYNVRRYCVANGDGETWIDEACPQGCYQGECSASACADECALGERGCVLWDLAASTVVDADPAGFMHDRARDYDGLLRRELMPDGGVGHGRYADTSYSQMVEFGGIVDSALWTGTALASQAWRLYETGCVDAVDRVRVISETLHTWFGVTGVPGFLARYATPWPSSVPFSHNCDSVKQHCDVPYENQNYYWRGDTSRDQYTGVMLGYLTAYLATPEADVRALIRDDVVLLVKELMVMRQDLPVHVTIGSLESDSSIDVENVIPVPPEMPDGKIQIVIDTSDYASSQLDGVREFLPDWGPALKQIPLLSWLPSVPRVGSAVMMGAFFQMALYMTDDVAGFEADHQAILSYYEAHADAWLGIAEQWSYENECSGKYYGTHIELIMAHVYALLETEPGRRARVLGVLEANRARLGGHKNAYYAFLWNAPLASLDDAEILEAVAQLSQFEPGPRVHIGRDSTALYPLDPNCSSPDDPRSSVAVDVGDRVLSDFLWQRHPFGLLSAGDPLEILPGVDYLAAYWLARRFGMLADDRAGTCTRRMQ